MEDLEINRMLQHNFITNYIKDLKLKDELESGFDINWIRYRRVCCRMCGGCCMLVNYIQHQYSKKHVRAINQASRVYVESLQHQ